MHASTASRALLALSILGFGGLGYAAWEHRAQARELRDEIARLREDAQALTRTVHLLRFERGGQSGASALLEQLRHWAPKLAVATTPSAEIPDIQRRVDDLIAAFRACGPDAWPVLQKAFDTTTSEYDDETRKWLLVAMTRVDATRGRELLARLIRGLDIAASPRLRLFACDELTRLDKPLAGRVVHDLLGYASSQGINTDRIPLAYAKDLAPHVTGAAAYSGFHNFVARYIATDDPELEPTLLMLLGRSEHDLVTMQECVKELGKRKSKPALARIQELFAAPPGFQDNPLFRNHCLEAIAAIEGARARVWLEARLAEEKSDLVITKLQDLLKR